MLDLRKSILLLVVVAAMASVANAQLAPPVQCSVTTGVIPLVRGEAYADQVGDIVISCTGGTPTAPGSDVPRINIDVFLNTNVTSRILAGKWLEALLLIDEPAPANQLVCGAAGSGFNAALDTCQITAPATYDGTTGQPNIFQAQQGATPNAIRFLGVPIDPPGTGNTRIIRITNIRADAEALFVPGQLIPSQIIGFLAVSDPTRLPVPVPQLTLALIQQGLSFSVQGAPITFPQCEAANCGSFKVRYSELFATAFKLRDAGGDQPIPGFVYHTESMLTNSLWPDLTALPTGSRGNLGASAGRATQATRFRAHFTGVPSGVSLYVTVGAVGATGANAGTYVSGADSAGAGGSTTTSGDSVSSVCGSWPSGWTPVRSVSLDASGNGTVFWEITGTDPNQIGYIEFGVLVKYSPLPGLGTAYVNGTYAPLYVGSASAKLWSSTLPVPRFTGDPADRREIFSVIRCQTNLLWPYVTNQAGFDTGMVIANTSRDPYGTGLQEGPCTLYYYTWDGSPAPASQTTSIIPAGQQAIWTLSSGGNRDIAGTPGFQGYVIARCEFRYAHGYAFISDIGATKLAQGYLALILDEGGLVRTGQIGEVLGN